MRRPRSAASSGAGRALRAARSGAPLRAGGWSGASGRPGSVEPYAPRCAGGQAKSGASCGTTSRASAPSPAALHACRACETERRAGRVARLGAAGSGSGCSKVGRDALCRHDRLVAKCRGPVVQSIESTLEH